mmetsp:Transcript_32229/g.68201  ORF Transcript_32229/g.68201 Transcript_32229/m.68201 type:complete len:442 (-) Transcript_32229:1125-2450(-)
MGPLFRLDKIPCYLAFFSAAMMVWSHWTLPPFHSEPIDLSHEQRPVVNASGPPLEKGERASSIFLTPELDDLIRSWENSTLSDENAKSAIWGIVQSKSFVDHKPSHGIVFMKTHKTASSTITSILHSIATSHNLVAPVTKKTAPFDPRGAKGRKELLGLLTTIPGIQSAPYDIWCNHVKFHESLLTRAVPSSYGKLFSIVRDPGTRLRSACAYYHCCPAETEEEWAEFVLSDHGKAGSWNKGFCEFDQSSGEIYGPSLTKETQAAVQSRANRGELLLLVMERMSESMLVLWDFYKLHPLDVTFISQKVRTKNLNVEEEKSNRTKLAETLVREMNSYDSALHKFANTLLTKKVEALMPNKAIRDRAMKEVELLNDLLHHICQPNLYGVTSDLNFWCKEKTFDNVSWNDYHLRRVNSQKHTAAVGHRQNDRGRMQRMRQYSLR